MALFDRNQGRACCEGGGGDLERKATEERGFEHARGGPLEKAPTPQHMDTIYIEEKRELGPTKNSEHHLSAVGLMAHRMRGAAC